MKKKTRSDSELQSQIPEEQQKAIIALMRTTAIKKCVEVLRAEPFNIETSTGSLSRFWHWWFAEKQIEEWAKNAKDFETNLRAMREAQKININDETIEEFGQAHFTMLAVRENDPKLFVAMKGKKQTDRHLNLIERDVKVREETFQVKTCELFLKWFKDEKARTIAEGSATNSEKIAALRQTYFKDVDVLEQSGEVVMPS